MLLTENPLTPQAATSPPLYLGTSIMASRNAALSLALTAPAAPNVGADGQVRSIGSKGEEEDSELESIRKLLSAGTRSAAGAFQPNWSVLRLLERIKAHNKQKESEAAVRAAGQQKQPQLPTGGPGGGPPPPTNEEKKKTKKKRPAETAADDGEKKPVKKKKAAPKVAPAAADDKKEEPKKAEPKKGAKKEGTTKKKAAPKKKAEEK